MNISIHFNNQCCLVTVEIDNKAGNDLLPSKVDSQLVRPQFLPEDVFQQESYRGGVLLRVEAFLL